MAHGSVNCTAHQDIILVTMDAGSALVEKVC